MMIYLEITEHLDLGKIIFTKITHLDLATKIKLVSTLKLFLGFLTFKSNYFPEQIRACSHKLDLFHVIIFPLCSS